MQQGQSLQRGDTVPLNLGALGKRKAAQYIATPPVIGELAQRGLQKRSETDGRFPEKNFVHAALLVQ